MRIGPEIDFPEAGRLRVAHHRPAARRDTEAQRVCSPAGIARLAAASSRRAAASGRRRGRTSVVTPMRARVMCAPLNSKVSTGTSPAFRSTCRLTADARPAVPTNGPGDLAFAKQEKGGDRRAQEFASGGRKMMVGVPVHHATLRPVAAAGWRARWRCRAVKVRGAKHMRPMLAATPRRCIARGQCRTVPCAYWWPADSRRTPRRGHCKAGQENEDASWLRAATQRAAAPPSARARAGSVPVANSRFRYCPV